MKRPPSRRDRATSRREPEENRRPARAWAPRVAVSSGAVVVTAALICAGAVGFHYGGLWSAVLGAAAALGLAATARLAHGSLSRLRIPALLATARRTTKRRFPRSHASPGSLDVHHEAARQVRSSRSPAKPVPSNQRPHAPEPQVH